MRIYSFLSRPGSLSIADLELCVSCTSRRRAFEQNEVVIAGVGPGLIATPLFFSISFVALWKLTMGMKG